ncbi:helix-turn-helix transcriptional regulator [Aquirufa nivalisilvae]|uniref:helix-turn-helix domain-containing protein n=1 Tax=Aquirufa nivalisilvae TaxID=2516557 RepID=UPI0022A8E869|nr:AraC family transcriptional regulator [Aquirufa nivalisilvae]MCZ2479130.1 helix-turn-helix transcriptional regulator [Aquirufa nivalisilvae]MCZ2483204.1 helix-turn-helix transcriptional regulator [Aquirufa nivalisilvae]
MLIYIVAFKLIISLVLAVFNFRVNKNTIYLTGFLVTIALSGLLHYFAFMGDNASLMAVFNYHITPTYYLFGPFLFFYVRGTLTDRNKLSRRDYFHFIPAVISFLSIVPFYFKNWDYKLIVARKIIDNPEVLKVWNEGVLYPSYFNVIGRPMFFMIYLIATIALFLRYNRSLAKYGPVSAQKTLIKRWLVWLISLSTLACASYFAGAIMFIFSDVVNKELVNSSPLGYLTGVFFLTIPLLILAFPPILYGIPIHKKGKRKNFEHKVDASDVYSFVGKSDDPFQQDAKYILDNIHEEKWYLDPEFNVDFLALKLDIPKHHIYYCFNYIIKSKFTKLRAQLRISHAKRLLEEKKSQNLSQEDMESIALTSGFGTLYRFISAFQEEEGTTPMEYVKKL